AAAERVCGLALPRLARAGLRGSRRARGGSRELRADEEPFLDASFAPKLAARSMTLELKRTIIGGKINDFMNVVDYIYKRDPNYIRPLDMDMKDRLSFKNPFFEHGDGVIFTAYRNGFCVGRCTAQIDREHLARYKDDVGFFGFFDTIEDQ